jgi:vacuolar-type H+-ATPase subunit I/STV1
VAGKTTGADRPSSGPPVDAGTARGSLRAAAGVLLLGGLIFFAGVSRPVVGEWAEAFDDEAKRISIAKADADQFTVAFVLMGVGFIVMGIALGLWGRAVTGVETGRRVTAAVVLGLTAVIGGFGPGLVRVITPLVDVERAAGDSGALNVAFLIGAYALALGFVGFGILTWRGPAPRWAGILLALTGVAAAVTFPAWYMLGAIVFGLVGVVHFRRSWPRKPYPPAGTR